MTINITNTQKVKANRKARRDADILFGLTNRTRTAVYKNKKAYDRKRDKKVIY
jgi:accessory colonization factor AcfC